MLTPIYFLGAVYTELQRYEAAIAAHQRALALNPFHVSAEFGLARAYQRTGESGQARQHLTRFRQLTEEKLGVPIGLVYGDQGRYARAEQVTPELQEGAARHSGRLRTRHSRGGSPL